MLKAFKADLHIHTCLSPCTELDMSPKKILKSAEEKKIDILAVCDHNSTENSQAIIQAAKSMEIRIIPGMEVTSEEEVHVLALFDDIDQALKLQDHVYQHLPGKNDPDVFGMQVIVNSEEDVLGFCEKLLIGATTIPLDEIIQTIHSLGGLAIASHINRQSFSIISQLGFIPEDLGLDAVEISSHMTLEEARKIFSIKHPITQSSDAHYPADIGKGFTSFLLESKTVAEMKKALKGEDGRKIL